MKLYFYPKICLFLMALGFVLPNLKAQEYGFEWIKNPNAPFVRFQSSTTGIHRITYQQLKDLGFPVDGVVKPQFYQLYNMGKEVSIHIKGDDDGSFGAADYIEFFGIATNGYFDNAFYPNPDFRTSHATSAYSMPNVYFLTVGDTQGKRTQSYLEYSSGLTPEKFHIERDLYTPNEFFAKGALYPTNLVSSVEKGGLLSHWVEGKGFTSNSVALGKTKVFTRKIENYIKSAGILPRLAVSVMGRTNVENKFAKLYVGTNAKPKAADHTKGFYLPLYAIQKDSFEITTPLTFPDSTGDLYYSLLSQGDAGAHVSANYFHLYYPQGFNLNKKTTKTYYIQPNSKQKALVNLYNVVPNLRIMDITDTHDAITVYPVSYTTQSLSFVVKDLTAERKIWVSSKVDTLANGEKVNFLFSVNPKNFNYIIIADPKLMTKSGQYTNPVQAYADYRKSKEGGEYTPIIFTYRELCNFFNYGLQTPHAIRQMAKWFLDKGNPKYLFIIGKGYEVWAGNSSLPFDGSIQTFGSPGSDNQFTANIKDIYYAPEIATGRLPATKPDQVVNYLNKVREHESVGTDAPWRKKILLLSGGNTKLENNIFKNYTDGFKRIAQNGYLGADVKILTKKSTEYVEYINFSEELNNGLAMIEFFGHADLQVVDIDIGFVSKPSYGYNNKGKYPFILVNGCGSGNIFTRKVSFAEDWVLTKDKGAIAYLAHSHIGFSNPLQAYTSNFFSTAFSQPENINKTVGEIVQIAHKRYITFLGLNNYLAITNAQQFTLTGDPAVKFITLQKPDYHIDESRLSLAPHSPLQPVAAVSDSFKLNIAVANVGITDQKKTPIKIRVKRTLPNGVEIWYDEQAFDYVKHEDSVSFSIQNPENLKSEIAGTNKFEVFLDFDNEVDEIREDNNYAVLETIIAGSAILAISPNPFSIMADSKPHFVAHNIRYQGALEEIELELDTTFHFNSALRIKKTTQAATIAEWDIDLPTVKDSTVFYWRVRKQKNENSSPVDTIWAESSFTLIPKSPQGWSQSHARQFNKNILQGVNHDEAKRKWTFSEFTKMLKVGTYGAKHPDRLKYYAILGGDSLIKANCSYGNFYLTLTIDQYTGRVYNSRSHVYNGSCGSSLISARLSKSGDLFNYIKNIERGDWFVILSTGSLKYDNAFWASVDSLGGDSQTLRTKLVNGMNFILVGRKGAAKGSAKIILPTTETPATEAISIETNIGGANNRGFITSTTIGPSTKWDKVYRNFGDADSPKDAWKMEIYGITPTKAEKLLFKEVKENGMDLSSINAKEYPYLRLKATVMDSTKLTPYQLKKWEVLYSEVPDGILMYDTTSYKPGSVASIVHGDSLNLRFYFKNASSTDFAEKIVIKSTVLEVSSNKLETIYDTIPALKKYENYLFKPSYFPKATLGDNILTVYANPHLQAERNYENNVLKATYRVKADNIPPVLDVTFDGVRILNNDIIAPQPTIAIQIKDENKLFVRQDTVGISLYLSRCDTCANEQLYFSDALVKWSASTDNNFVVEYQPPQALEDGTYTLIVEATDMNGNRPSLEPYKIKFRVVNKATISNFYPYPNPFSSNMKFVFTLTGADIPDDILIRIMTIKGTVVREITKEELGNIRIGNNISEFSWDGTDQYGDKLANGVYFYKVYIRNQEQILEHFDTSADKLFEHGFGKIYLMR